MDSSISENTKDKVVLNVQVYGIKFKLTKSKEAMSFQEDKRHSSYSCYAHEKHGSRLAGKWEED